MGRRWGRGLGRHLLTELRIAEIRNPQIGCGHCPAQISPARKGNGRTDSKVLPLSAARIEQASLAGDVKGQSRIGEGASTDDVGTCLANPFPTPC